jgi:hypothetical protein
MFDKSKYMCTQYNVLRSIRRSMARSEGGVSEVIALPDGWWAKAGDCKTDLLPLDKQSKLDQFASNAVLLEYM